MSDFMLKVAQWMTQNKYIQALIGGMMSIMPIMLGVAAVAVLVNLPFDGWQYFLENTAGLHGHMNDLLAATSTLTALYISFAIAYHFAKNEGANGLMTGILSVASFLVLMPQVIQADAYGYYVVNGLGRNFLGSDGVFVAMINALFIGRLYTWLMSKNLKLKLPEGVPPMVAESLSPTFVSMILFAIVLAIRVLVGLTSHGNVFSLLNETVGGLVVNFGATPWAGVAVFTLIAFGWFFGIHPTAMMSVYIPVMMTAGIANTEAFLAGEAMPHLHFSAMMGIIAVGGTGGTLGLSFLMLRAKSAHFKAIGKVSLIPGLFNINEPFLFGVPLMLNPLFLIPMVTNVAVAGVVVTTFYNLGAYNSMNPTVAMPWIMPAPIGAFFVGGWSMALAIITVIVAQATLYLPFFIIADRRAYAEEQKAVGDKI